MTHTPKPEERAPYSAHGSCSIMTPDGSLILFQGGFERDEILKLLSAAHTQGVLEGQQVERERVVGQAIIDQSQEEAVLQAHRIQSLPAHRDMGRSKIIEGFISGARFAVDQFAVRTHTLTTPNTPNDEQHK